MFFGSPLMTLVAAIILLPYATIGLEERTSLLVQAAGITVFSGFALFLGSRRRPLSLALRDVRCPILVGVVLHSGASLMGSVVGLASSNQPDFVVGQTLSMGLLPMTVVAGALSGAMAWRAVARGIFLATVLGAAFHLTATVVAFASGTRLARFYFENGVSVTGHVLVALLAGLALRPRSRWLRVAWFFGLAALGLQALGSQVRGLWLVAPPALLAYLLFELRSTRRNLARIFGSLAAVSLACLLVLLVVNSWLALERPSLLEAERALDLLATKASAERRPDAPRAEGDGVTWGSGGQQVRWVLSRPIDMPTEGSYLLTAEVASDGAFGGRVGLRWLSSSGIVVGSSQAVIPARAGRHLVRVVDFKPEGGSAIQLFVGGIRGSEDRWWIGEVRLVRLNSSRWPLLIKHASGLVQRLRTVRAILRYPTAYRSTAARLAEIRAVWRTFGEAPFLKKCIGHGLGATYRLPTYEEFPFTSRLGPEPNYIHNYYMFLLFKLGIVGACLVLSGLLAWSGYCLRRAWSEGSSARSASAATLLALVAYALWSVVSPELLDFRVAPVLGLLLGALSALPEAEAKPC